MPCLRRAARVCGPVVVVVVAVVVVAAAADTGVGAGVGPQDDNPLARAAAGRVRGRLDAAAAAAAAAAPPGALLVIVAVGAKHRQAVAVLHWRSQPWLCRNEKVSVVIEAMQCRVGVAQNGQASRPGGNLRWTACSPPARAVEVQLCGPFHSVQVAPGAQAGHLARDGPGYGYGYGESRACS